MTNRFSSILGRPDVLTVLATAPTYMATSEALKSISPLDLTPIRFLSAAAVLGICMKLRGTPFRLLRADTPRMTLAAFAGYAGYGTLLNMGQTTVPAGTTSLLLNMSPVFACLLGYVVFGEKVSRRGLVGLGLACLGVVVIAVFGGGELGFDWNCLPIVAAALLLALFLVWQQPLLTRAHPMQIAFWGCLLGGLMTMPFASFEPPTQPWPGSAWLALGILAVISTAAGFWLWNTSLAASSVAAGGTLLLAVPIFSVALGWLVLSQVPTPGILLGGALALGGVCLLNSSDSQPASKETVLQYQ